jgi:hypothetical protein
MTTAVRCGGRVGCAAVLPRARSGYVGRDRAPGGGIAAIDDSTFFTANAKYVITDLNTWGWVVLGVGAVQFLSAFAIWAGSEWGRWVGIISAGCNAIVQMFFISGFPLLSVTLFAVDVLVIYGLVTYGGHRRAGA